MSGSDFVLSFREVIPDQTNAPTSQRKDITINTGASQSTLQDIKVAEPAGGFCYANATSVHTRNRFIHWRTQHDCLELTETSLDANLIDNHVLYRFTDAPVLAASVHETHQHVVLLVVTVSSVHRLSYTHPELMARRHVNATLTSGGAGGDPNAPGLSVFYEANAQAPRDPSAYHVLGHVGGGSAGSAIPHTAAAWLTANGQEALFALAYQTTLLLYTMHTGTGQTVVTELKQQHTIVPRIFSNITGALRGKSSNTDSQYAVSLAFGEAGTAQSAFVFALYRDDHVRMWSTRSGQCVSTLNCVPEAAGGGSGETRPQGPQQNTLRRFTGASNGAPALCAFLSHSLAAEFVTIRVCVSNSSATEAAGGAAADAARFTLQRGACIPAPPNDLVDFEVDAERLWALWCNAHGDFTVASYALHANEGSSRLGQDIGDGLCWQTAILEPIVEPVQAVEATADPKETFCAHIFHPGRFQRDVIAKALLMYCHNSSTSVTSGSAAAVYSTLSGIVAGGNCPASAPTTVDGTTLSLQVLRERACTAIELEVVAEVAGYEAAAQMQSLSDEDVLEMSHAQWERFYAGVEQYHVKMCQPIGVFGLGSVGGVCVVRKRTVSLLRPCELLEHLMMQASGEGDGGRDGCGADGMDGLEDGGGGRGYESADVRAVRAALSVDATAAGDLVRLVRILATMERRMGEHLKRDVHERLYQLHMPNVVVAELLASDNEADEARVFTRDFVQAMQCDVRAIGDLRTAMHLLLETLRMDEDEQMVQYNHLLAPRQLLALGPLFAGDWGISTLAETLKQVALVRYALSRNLLVLQQLLVDRFDVGCDVLEDVRSNCMPSTVVFVQAYYVMVWLCEIPVQSGYAAATLEHNIQRLNVLQISAASRRIIRPLQPVTLLEFFLRSRGLQAGWTAYVEANPQRQRVAKGSQWSQTLLPMVTALGQLLWSVSGNFTFGEWLIGSCQHILIQEYVRLLNSWCEWNSCSRHFIAAVTLLETGEPAKAFDLFMQSAKGVLTEPFLEACIVPQDQAVSDNEAMTAYYLKVIQLFEQHGALDHVIALAKTAIGILEPDDPQLAMFQSIVFANHLQLEHYDEAYHALIENAEPARRKDCLRQLVVGLFQQRRLDLLMRFPYVRLQDELEEIVEARARAHRVRDNPYYDFLYAFHVTKDNFRRGAAIMYEKAMRLQSGDGLAEFETLPDGVATALQARYECLLACQNALHLVDERYAWLAKPVLLTEETSASRLDTGDETDAFGYDEPQPHQTAAQQQRVQVVELAEIGRELQMCESQLTLLRHRPDLQAAAVHVDAEQIVTALASNGLYTAAVNLACRGLTAASAAQRRHRLVGTVLEHLAGACVRADDDEEAGAAEETWSWLKENDLADVPHRNRAAEMVWGLLRKLLEDNESDEDVEETGDAEERSNAAALSPTATRLHRAVAGKLIACGVFLPHWLAESYQRRRPAELLMLYVQNGRLVEAGQLAIGLIWAMMSVGGEYYGLRNSLHITKPALCFPVTAVDQLLHGLDANAGEDAEYVELATEVRAVVQRYVETVRRVSANRVEYCGQELARAAVAQRQF